MSVKKLPKHVAIILDGNGRWAKERYLPRAKGHIEGVKRVEEILDASVEKGIEILTLYTFSTENWRRPKNEVSLLMTILNAVLHRKLKKLQRDNIRFDIIGRLDRIPEPLLTTIRNSIEDTKKNTGLILNLAFNYGSRAEIIEAIKGIAQSVVDGQMKIDDISEQVVSDHLFTKGLCDPDLLIRTSGEKRISNFLLWQLSYSELYFTDKYWPDFTKEEFDIALEDYQMRERRFGNVKAPS